MKKIVSASSINKDLKVKVYMETINYVGEITERNLIAAFRSNNWAKDFIDNLPDYPNTQYTIINNDEELPR